MSLDWDDSLILGNSEIDESHRQIFSHFEKLSLACLDGQGEEVLKGLLKYLDDYTNEHFSCEEALMLQHNYPKLTEQQSQHAQFRLAVSKFKDMDMKNMDAQQLSVLIYRQLFTWFSQHIKKFDQEMVNYIVAHQHY